MQTKSRFASHKKKKHWHKENYAHRKISGSVQALDSLVSPEKSTWWHAVNSWRPSVQTTIPEVVQAVQALSDLVKREQKWQQCTESEKSLNAPVRSWEERGGGE